VKTTSRKRSAKKAESRSIIGWIILGFTVAMAVVIWTRRARKVEELARSRQREALDRAEKLERQLRDLSMKVSEMSRSRI
jgi:hypothetical protein